jgi:hypothetical protein
VAPVKQKNGSRESGRSGAPSPSRIVPLMPSRSAKFPPEGLLPSNVASIRRCCQSDNHLVRTGSRAALVLRRPPSGHLAVFCPTWGSGILPGPGVSSPTRTMIRWGQGSASGLLWSKRVRCNPWEELLPISDDNAPICDIPIAINRELSGFVLHTSGKILTLGGKNQHTSDPLNCPASNSIAMWSSL